MTPTIQRHQVFSIVRALLVVAAAIIAFGALTRDGLTEAHLVERARSEGAAAGKAAGKAEVNAQVDNKVATEVQDQLDRRLLPNTATSLPTHLEPIEPVGPTTTTTEPEPFNLTTTTLPEETTTTTTIEVPTTVTIPDPLPDP